LTKRKLLSALCHGATFLSFSFAGILVPIVVLLFTNDGIVQENAKEAINYHISFFIYYVIFILLAFLIIGIPFLILLIALDFCLSIIAIVHCLTNTHSPYRYPMISRFI
jgi:uncharacterized Tic20 family protein